MNSATHHTTSTASLPEVVAERCVHSLIEQASCQACVQGCPHDAWQLNDEALALDADKCTSCGLCAAACPQGAIQHQHLIELRTLNDTPVALCACEHSGVAGQAVMQCLHALSLTQLLRLYQQGVRAILATTGDCEHCECFPKDPAKPLAERLHDLNTSLAQRQRPMLHYRVLPQAMWESYHQRLPQLEATSALARRYFFQHTWQAANQPALRSSAVVPFLPPATLLPPTKQTPATLPYVPELNTKQCNGCGVCFKVCPHEALTINAADHCYHIHAEQCTGCGLCEDLCSEAAIDIKQWALPTQVEIPLHSTRCQRCGVSFQRPAAYDGDQRLCSICLKVNHHSKLFQVLD